MAHEDTILTCTFGFQELIPQLILFTLMFLMFVAMVLPEFTRRAAAEKRAQEIKASRSHVETGNLEAAGEESSVLSSGHSKTSLRNEEDPSTFGTSTDASFAHDVTGDSQFSTAALEERSGVSAVDERSGVSALEERSGVSALEERSGVSALEERSGVSALEERSGVSAVDERSGVSALDERSGVSALDEPSGVSAVEDSSGVH